MGVSFKVARMGTRYRPKLVEVENDRLDEEENESSDSRSSGDQGNFSGVGNKISALSCGVAKNALIPSASDGNECFFPCSLLDVLRNASFDNVVFADIEVSFSLHLFPNGFSIGKVSESFNIAPDKLYPYNRSSETLFSAIEYGWLPGDIFDDLPIKYVNGHVLCEIHDYRNCLLQKEGICSIQKSPIVHRVILQMSMENVVKDIMLISDDSWTYNDLLEVESRIVKALQPNLCLNPQPSMGIHYGETLTKKVNLEISWSWKKRKQCNAPTTTNQIFTEDLSHATLTPSDSACQNVHQDEGVMLAKKDIPTLVLEKTNTQVYPLTSHQNFQLEKTRVPLTLVGLGASNSSVPIGATKKRTIDKTKPTSSNLIVTEVYHDQAIQQPAIKKPKEEPVDFSYPQFLGESITASVTPQLQRQNALVHQKIEAGKVLPERFQDKGHLSQLLTSRLALTRRDIPYSAFGSATSNLKQESLNFPGIVLGNMEDMRVNFTDGVPIQGQQALHLLKTDNRIENALKNPIAHAIEKHGAKGKLSSRRNVLEKPRLICDGSTAPSSQNVESTKAITILKRKATPDVKSWSISLFDSNTYRKHVQIANANRISEGINPLSHTSEIEGGRILERFSKIKELTQRCKLIKKPKLDEMLVTKGENFHKTENVAFHLSHCEESNISVATIWDQVYSSQLSMGANNVCKARILMFVRQESPVIEDGIHFHGGETHIRLELAQEFNKIQVEANVLYGSKYEDAPTVLSPIPTFPCARYAERFITQFCSLMTREGYLLAYDHVLPKYPEIEGRQEPSSTVNQPSETSEPPCKPNFNPMTANMSVHNSSHLQFKQNYPEEGGQLPLTENVQSSPQFTSNHLPNLDLDLDFTAQLSSITSQIQAVIERGQLRHQIQERQRIQELLMQRKAMLGGVAAMNAAGCLGPRNFNFGSVGNNVTNPMASSNNKIYEGARMLSVGNIGQKNNPCSSNSFGLNDNKRVLASTPSTGNGQWGGLEDVVQGCRNPKPIANQWQQVGSSPSQHNLESVNFGQQVGSSSSTGLNSPQTEQCSLESVNFGLQVQHYAQLLQPNRGSSESVNFGQQASSSFAGLNSQQFPQPPPQTNHQHSVESVNFSQHVQQYALLLQTNHGSLESVNFGSSSSEVNSQQFAQPPQTIQQRQQKPKPVSVGTRKKSTKGSQGTVQTGRKK
ncbi:hypothetical protein G4B88_004317 [Cannabis sativa]|uniref:Uncharacterized protein n=1 Tax=Cannabis sativa TaxID=3483 RepID=A0A7J6E9J5_CANSA|nr:hypothetical protein G4B88_004317 [Cannabis sativa]